jgi:DNA-binding transcriptional LysR family regulator
MSGGCSPNRSCSWSRPTTRSQPGPRSRRPTSPGLQVLSLGPDFVLHDQIVAICAEHGAEIVRDYEGTSLDALRQMVAMGMGVTFLPQLYVTSEIDPRERPSSPCRSRAGAFRAPSALSGGAARGRASSTTGSPRNW